MYDKKISPFEQLSTKTVYENRWMRVREDLVRFPNGSEGIFGVVDKADFVLIVPIEADGRIHMVQQFRYAVGDRFWEFPQGAWETNADANPLSVAAGELEEETGIRSGTMRQVGKVYEAYGYSSQCFRVFIATDLTQGAPKRDAEEQDMVTRAFTLDEITDMIRNGAIKGCTTIAAVGYLKLLGEL